MDDNKIPKVKLLYIHEKISTYYQVGWEMIEVQQHHNPDSYSCAHLACIMQASTSCLPTPICLADGITARLASFGK